MRFACPTCSQLLECPDNLIGAKVTCPKCNQRILVPTPPPQTKAGTNKTKLGKIVDAPADPPTALSADDVPVAKAAPAKRKAAPVFIKPIDDVLKRIPKWAQIVLVGGTVSLVLSLFCCSAVFFPDRLASVVANPDDPTPTVKRMIENQYKVKVKSIILVRKTERMYSGFAMMEDGFQIEVHEAYIDDGKVFAKWEAPWITYPAGNKINDAPEFDPKKQFEEDLLEKFKDKLKKTK